jgi:hypothetical protein
MTDSSLADLLVKIILFGLISPAIALPSFLYGAVVRRWWLVPIGAAALAALFLAIAFDDAEFVWAAAPVALVPVLAWCTAGYRFGRWRRSRRGKTEPAGFARAASIVAGLLLGGVAGTAAGLGLGAAYIDLAQVSSFEGLSGYVVVYLFMAPGLIIGAIAGAIIAAMINRRLGARGAAPA